MRTDRQVGKVGRFKRGLASAMLVATLVAQVAPLATVSAARLDYEHGTGDVYKTIDTAQYRINVAPMMGSGVGNATVNPQGGTYRVEQIAEYTRTGERIPVTGTAQILNLKPSEVNDILLSGDGEYKITPVDRVPGYLNDLGATSKLDAEGNPEDLETPAGHYIYAFPLIDAGVPSDNQLVDFQPKLDEALATLEVEKIGDDQSTPLAGIDFTVYKTFDAKTQVNSASNPVEVATGTTNSSGKVSFANLIEGSYFFVEGESSVPATYLPDVRKVEFDVRVGVDGRSTAIVATEEDDIATVGNNIRGKQTGDTITRYNYVDPAQNIEETYQSVAGSDYWDNYINTTQGQATGKGDGIVYVDTNGRVSIASSVDVPKNFNDFSTFVFTDTIDERLTIVPDSFELRITQKDEGVVAQFNISGSEAIQFDGQTITVDAKHPSIVAEFEKLDVDYAILTYDATVDTAEIAEGTVFEELTNTQKLRADSKLEDGQDIVNETTRTTNLRVREGKVVVDKITNDGQESKLAGAEFQLYRTAQPEEESTFSYNSEDWIEATNPRSGANYFGTTDENGNLEFANLPFGEYLLVETRAPEGYRINNNHKRIVIDDETVFSGGVNTVTETVKNMRSSQIFPGTGTTGNILTLVALAVAGGTLVTVTVKKRKENEEVASEEA